MASVTTNILFCGLGGQGIVKASDICGIAAMHAGHHVKKAEIHGMSQRGGSIESHLRFGQNVHSPLIAPGAADFLVCFDAGEGRRLRHYLKADGVDFSGFLDNAKKAVPRVRFLNTYLLGLLSGYLDIAVETWLSALQQVLTRSIEENKDVFLLARGAGKNRTPEGK